MATAYHMEALRKQRIINKKHEALHRLAEKASEVAGIGEITAVDGQPLESTHFADQGHYDNSRNNLKPFRVNNIGFNNRYRNRQNFAPHCDLSHAVIYPDKDNSAYTNDLNSINRRMNLAAEKYDVSRRVNGEFNIGIGHELLPEFF